MKLVLTPIGQGVECMVTFNHEDCLFSGLVTDPVEIIEQVSLNTLIDLRIKVWREHPQAVKVNLTIDNHNVIPKYQQYANPATDYIDFEHGWSIQIDNAYQWLHEKSGQGWIA
jgi:hypothetical protein